MALELTWAEVDGEVKTLDVDALMREGNTGTSELTENPIELGADVTDHIRDKSDALTLEFVITNTPLRVPTSHMQGITGSVRKVDTKNGNVVALAFDSQFDRVKAVYDDLSRVRKAGLLWRIESPVRVYEDFLIETLAYARDNKTGDAATFILGMKRARFVSTRVVAIPRRRRTRPTVNTGTQATRPPRDSIGWRLFNRLSQD